MLPVPELCPAIPCGRKKEQDEKTPKPKRGRNKTPANAVCKWPPWEYPRQGLLLIVVILAALVIAGAALVGKHARVLLIVVGLAVVAAAAVVDRGAGGAAGAGVSGGGGSVGSHCDVVGGLVVGVVRLSFEVGRCVR